MDYTKLAIEKAISGGYMSPNLLGVGVGYYNDVFLDPLFWQSLGKAEGWPQDENIPEITFGIWERERWLGKWHRFIDSLADGNTPEQYFENLLSKSK